MLKKNHTVDDIFQLLIANGASRDPKSPIRILDYDQLIPSKKHLNNLKTLGRGGYGAVYQINIDGLDYALKIMTQKRGDTQQELINSFYNECKSLLSVNHNRVLRIVGVAIDTSEEDEHCFCHYTNYQQKGNLFDLIRNKQLFPDSPSSSPQRFYKKLRLLNQIAEGIHAIHAVGLIHRDIKAQNIFLDENDSPKVANLGLAGNGMHSKTTCARGTIQWMAPEVFEYKVSHASDI